MSFFDRFKKRAVTLNQSIAYLPTSAGFSLSGYHRLWDCPEVVAAVNVYAQMIGGATIYLMQNGTDGDKRIKNELSRLIDIKPNPLMTKQTFYEGLVRSLLMNGGGNQITLPIMKDGLIDHLRPLEPSKVEFVTNGESYRVIYNQMHRFEPDEFLHFRLNPDPEYPWKGTGYNILLQDVVKSLKQSNATKNSLLENPQPSIIVKVDGLTDEMATPDGRARLTREYSPASGQPWVIPGELMDVQQVKPLTLKDLAIRDGLELDRRETAMMLGVPPFLVGVGDFNRDEYNNFIRTKVMWVSKAITQELTRQLLISPDWYFKQSARSLYAYEIKDLAEMGINLRKAGVMTGNEVRDLIDMSPIKGLNDLVMLENYIPSDKLGDQQKLVQEKDL